MANHQTFSLDPQTIKELTFLAAQRRISRSAILRQLVGEKYQEIQNGLEFTRSAQDADARDLRDTESLNRAAMHG